MELTRLPTAATVVTPVDQPVASDKGITIANPLRPGAKATDNDHVAYFADGTIDFVVDDELWNLGEKDGTAYKVEKGQWAEQAKVPTKVSETYNKLIAFDPNKAAAKEASGSSAAAETAAAKPTPMADVIEARGSGEATSVTQGGQIAQLEQRLAALERVNREQTDSLRQMEEARAAEEAKAAADAKKPSFFRALLEIFEFIGRFLTPITNLVSACVRLVKVAVKLCQGQQIDWKKEGLRMLGDVVGIFCPPAGAIANTAFNLWWNESQILGGVNEIFDKATVANPFRTVAEKVVDVVGNGASSLGRAITGQGVKAGSSADDGLVPLAAPAEPAEIAI